MSIRTHNSQPFVPHWWKWVLLACSTVILCSCNSVRSGHQGPPGADPAMMQGPMGPPAYSAMLPAAADYGYDLPHSGAAGACNQCQHCQAAANGGGGPGAGKVDCGVWPPDEWIVDGGDKPSPAQVAEDWQVRGLDVEDTIGHFDTIDGRTVVVPSNCVPIYAPRFASVRVVRAPVQGEQVEAPRGEHLNMPAIPLEEKTPVYVSTQPLQPGRQLGTRQADAFRMRQWDGVVSEGQHAREFADQIKPYENLSIIRYGIAEQAEKAVLAQRVDAAMTWSSDQAVQVMVEGRAASVLNENQKAELTYTVDPQGEPQLRVIKIASKQFAEPGELIDFTIRFDNIGSQPMGNVTIMDSLTGRLEYIEDSQQASVKTFRLKRDENGNVVKHPDTGLPLRAQNPVNFSTQPNNADSVILRWEIMEPLEAGQGGIVRFQCRVR